MKPHIWAIVARVIATVLVAGCQVDQQQLVKGQSPVPLIGGVSHQQLAQTVTAGISGDLIEIRAPVVCNPGSNVTVEIQGATTGLPNGTVLASEILSPPVLPDPPYVPVKLSTPVFFARNTQFAIVFKSDGLCFAFDGPNLDSYIPGNGYFQGDGTAGNWVCLCAGAQPKPWDLGFQTVVFVFGTASTVDQEVGAGHESNPQNQVCDIRPLTACNPEMFLPPR